MNNVFKCLAVVIAIYLIPNHQAFAQSEVEIEKFGKFNIEIEEFDELDGIFDALEFSDINDERLGDKEIIKFLENNIPEFAADLQKLKTESREEYRDALELANIEILLHRKIVNLDRDAGQANIALHRVMFHLNSYIEGLAEIETEEDELSEAEQEEVRNKIRSILEEGLPHFIKKSRAELLIMEKEIDQFSANHELQNKVLDKLITILLSQNNEDEEDEEESFDVDDLIEGMESEEIDIDTFMVYEYLSVAKLHSERLSDREILEFLKTYLPEISEELKKINRNDEDEFREVMDEANEYVLLHKRIKKFDEVAAAALIEVIKIESKIERLLESEEDIEESEESPSREKIKTLLKKGLSFYILSQKAELFLIKQELAEFATNTEEQKEAIDYLLEKLEEELLVEDDEEENDERVDREENDDEEEDEENEN